MPTVSSFDSLIGRLRATPAEEFRAACAEILTAPVNWPSVVRDHLWKISAERYVDGTRQIFVEGVEPKTLLLHDEPDRFRVVLNHFDRESFRLHQREGRITPHFHSFDFATRVISGSYHHLLYDNAGELMRPRLSLRHRTRDEVDHVYVLPWNEFHCVLGPQENTMSLQIRGPVQFRPRRPAPTLTSRELLVARDCALDALDSAAADSPTPAAGHVPEFAHCWL